MRVLLAEDAVILRDGLARLLADHGHDVVAAVADGDRVREAAERTDPDVAVLDIRMPPTHTDEGLRAARVIREEMPDTGVLVLSQYVEEAYALELLGDAEAGVGYLLKDRVS
ncbi:MAG: response regulator, partial [Solirubrobacteraceae bacterium]